MKKTAYGNFLNAATREDLKEAEQLIYEVLEHLSAGRNNPDLMKQKLIQAWKNLPINHRQELIKYC
jgi:hypothetical protein